MAKFEKAKHEIVDIDEEVKKLTKTAKKEDKKKPVKKEDQTKKKSSKTKGKDSSKKVRKHSKVVEFFKDVKKEMSKVQFPTKKEMIKYSFSTIVFILFFGILYFAVDLIIAALKAWV